TCRYPRSRRCPLSVDPRPAGWTVRDVARRYRVSPDKVRSWIKKGELLAINTSSTRCGRPRFVVTIEALAMFESRRQGGPPPKPIRKRKQTGIVDYYPE